MVKWSSGQMVKIENNTSLCKMVIVLFHLIYFLNIYYILTYHLYFNPCVDVSAFIY